MEAQLLNLLKTPFSALNDEEKIAIALGPRPGASSDLAEWLVKSSVCVFCWPCLLFSPIKSQWTREGFVEKELLEQPSTLKEHEAWQAHVEAELSMQVFLKEHEKPEKSLDTIMEIENVERNRKMFKVLIDVVCHLATVKQPTGEQCQIAAEDCAESMHLLRYYDTKNYLSIDAALDLIQTKPSIVNDLVVVTSVILKEAVKKELYRSFFVSVMIGDNSDRFGLAQISTVLRYVHEGKVRERFVGFSGSSHSPPPSAQTLFLHFEDIMKTFGLTQKVVAFSYDEKIAPAEVLEEVLQLSQKYPKARMVPCYAHQLNRLLKQCLATTDEGRFFIQNLTASQEWFSHRNAIRTSLESFIANRSHGLLESWNELDFHELRLKRFRRIYVEFFDSMLQSPERWSAEDIVKARGFSRFLQSFETVFFLELYGLLFSSAKPLRDVLCRDPPMALGQTNLVGSVLQQMQSISDLGFSRLWPVVTQIAATSEFARDQQAICESRKQQVYKKRYQKMLGCLTREIQTRFSALHQWDFLLAFELSRVFSIPNLATYVDQINAAFGPIFDARLESELKVLLKRSDAAKLKTHELISFMYTRGLKSTLRETSKFLEMILASPRCNPKVFGGEFVTQDIRLWSGPLPEVGSKQDAAILCVEKEFLEQVMKRETFHNDVMSKFELLDRKIQLSLSSSQ